MRSRRLWRDVVIGLIALLAWIAAAPAETEPRHPGVEWEYLLPSQSGWSGKKLAAAKDWSRYIGSTAVVVVQHGAIVASWGDTDADLQLNSARKSLLSALIGIAVANGQIDLDETVGELGIDDNPLSLTPAEKQATVRDLLEARSGIYHGANYETAGMAAKRPPRGSHPPDTFWYYNNWDFNVLGAIYEHATGTGIFAAFSQKIAAPIGMQDFDPAKCRYSGGPASMYPAYLFYASARDLARFGLLYLSHGRWGDKQIIPDQWVRESTKPYSTTDIGSGYGYLWWTALADQPLVRLNAPAGTYFAWGHGGQFIFVIPAYDLVVVNLARTGRGQRHQRGVRLSGMLHLLSLIFDAMPGSGHGAH